MKRIRVCCLAALLTGLFLSQFVWAADRTIVHNIRAGTHADYTRLVFDSEGARPLRIGPASTDGITVQYEELDCRTIPEFLFKDPYGLVVRVSDQEERNTSDITIAFRHPNTMVNAHFLSGDPLKNVDYRLVLDFYPPDAYGAQQVSPSHVKQVAEKTEGQSPEIAEASGRGNRNPQAQTVQRQPSSGNPPPPKEVSILMADVEKTEDLKPPLPAQASGKEASPGKFPLSGEAGISPRYVKGDRDSAKAQEYRDLDAPVFGDLFARYEKEDEYFSEVTGEKIGRDDQHYAFGGGRYGKFRIEGSYDEIPHKFAFDAKNIYSGAGTGNLTLRDKQDVAFADRAARLNSLLATAVPIDIELKRKKGEMKLDVVALDPFSFRVEMGREKKEGTMPLFGSFGLDNTVEIPAPIDHNTTEIKAMGEYAGNELYFNVNYTLSLFKNNIGTLTWDNPFSATDAVFDPSKGLIDLAPDNDSHNLSLSGSLRDLPFNSSLSLVTAWGKMRQNDSLVPFTTNTAILSPSLPQNEVDAAVNTTLYQVLLTSKPLSLVRLKAKFRYFEYDNKTQQINFPSFVDADSNLVVPDAPGAASIVNLPASYDKTAAGMDLGFDLLKNTRLTVGSKFERTRRENREVNRQDDRVFKGSIDTTHFSWVTLGASYERTDRDIKEYDFDVYLRSGIDLAQLPGLRKYDQADMVRDRVEISATLYPLDSLVLRGSAIYGADDFNESPFGLLEDRHYIFSLDADYSITDRVILQSFFIHENYKNRQKDRGEIPGPPPADADWFSRSEDIINTVGAEVQVKLIPSILDLHVTYSLSDMDGNIDFFTPDASIADFPNADDARLQILGAKLNYRAIKHWLLTFGYLWEKFDYSDFNTEEFTNVPLDVDGNFNGAYLMGTLPGSYSVHIVYLGISYQF
jgi:MtrB/PioB family decaheme-associated outer membrane protein